MADNYDYPYECGRAYGIMQRIIDASKEKSKAGMKEAINLAKAWCDKQDRALKVK